MTIPHRFRLILVVTARRDVHARKAGGTITTPEAERTAQRAVPTFLSSFNLQHSTLN
jgi:hypothetical protein